VEDKVLLANFINLKKGTPGFCSNNAPIETQIEKLREMYVTHDEQKAIDEEEIENLKKTTSFSSRPSVALGKEWRRKSKSSMQKHPSYGGSKDSTTEKVEPV
jgi:hypothetical protein